jgi:hypothetical protein
MKSPFMTLRRWALGGLFGVALLAAVYGAYSYAGPYRWLAELSMSVFGSYSPKLTFLFSLVLLMLPAGVLSARFAPAAAPDQIRAAAVNAARMARIQLWLSVAVVGAVLLFVGGRDLLAARAGATLMRTSCASIEAGHMPAGTWLEIEGDAIVGAAVETKEGYASHAYVPLVSDTWSKAKPLAVVLRFTGDAPRDLNARSFQGGLSSEDLPGMVRTAYEAEGVEAESALVLNVGNVPNKNLTSRQLTAAAGLLALLIGGFMCWRKWN